MPAKLPGVPNLQVLPVLFMASALSFVAPSCDPGPTGREQEPNDDETSANVLNIGSEFSGKIDPLGDVDYYRIEGIDASVSAVYARVDPCLDVNINLMVVCGSLTFPGYKSGQGETTILTAPVTQADTYYLVVHAPPNMRRPEGFYCSKHFYRGELIRWEWQAPATP